MNVFEFFKSLDLFNSPHVLFLYMYLCIFLALAQVVVLALKQLKPSSKLVEVQYRIHSWWKIFGVSFLAIASGKQGATVLFCAISILALWEYIRVVELEKISKDLLVLSFLAIPIQYAFAFYGDYDLFLIFIPLLMQGLLALACILRQQTQGFIRTLGLLQWGSILTVFCLSHIVYFMNLDDPKTLEVEPLGLISFVIVITQINDVMQFLFGKAFGRRKILPRISPNKTVEGLLGGLLACAALSYLLGPYLTRLSPSESALSGVLLSLCGFFGDVFMSAIKRDKNIKDFGALLPGHGGILDRVDSLIIAAPAFFHFYRTFFSELY